MDHVGDTLSGTVTEHYANKIIRIETSPLYSPYRKGIAERLAEAYCNRSRVIIH